jgi:hypothetical protein
MAAPSRACRRHYRDAGGRLSLKAGSSHSSSLGHKYDVGFAAAAVSASGGGLGIGLMYHLFGKSVQGVKRDGAAAARAC